MSRRTFVDQMRRHVDDHAQIGKAETAGKVLVDKEDWVALRSFFKSSLFVPKSLNALRFKLGL